MGKNQNGLIAHTQEIVDLYLNGKTTVDIAKIFKCTDSAVWYLLKRNDITIRNRSFSSRKFTANFNFFDQIDTEGKAYVLGLLYADGCNHQATNRIILTLTDRDLVVDVAKAMTATNTIEIHDKQHNKPQYTLRISSKHMCERLTQIGCTPRKSLTCSFPGQLFLPDNLRWHFIRGYFDGDGSIFESNKQMNVSICGTQSFLEHIGTIINVDLIGTKWKIRNKKNIAELEIRSRQSVVNFMNKIYDGATILLPRKYNKYHALLENHKILIDQTVV